MPRVTFAPGPLPHKYPDGHPPEAKSERERKRPSKDPVNIDLQKENLKYEKSQYMISGQSEAKVESAAPEARKESYGNWTNKSKGREKDQFDIWLKRRIEMNTLIGRESNFIGIKFDNDDDDDIEDPLILRNNIDCNCDILSSFIKNTIAGFPSKSSFKNTSTKMAVQAIMGVSCALMSLTLLLQTIV